MKVYYIRHMYEVGVECTTDSSKFHVGWMCSHCNAQRELNPELDHFCPSCGHELSRPPIKGEIIGRDIARLINIAIGKEGNR